VTTSSKDGKIVKVNAKEDNGYICAIGRFGFDALKSANRVTTPMKKQGSKLVPTTWEEASKLAADALRKAGANAGFIASGSLTNEEAMAVQSLARDVVGTANVDTPASAYAGGAIAALRAVYGDAGLAIASQADLKLADCVVVIGADPTQKGQSLQEVDVMIRRRAQAGAKVIVVNPEKIGLTTHANAVHLELKPGTDAALLAGVMSAALAEGLTTDQKGLDGLKKSLVSADEAAKISGVTAEKIAEAAKAFAASKQPVVIFGTGISANEDASLQALNLALLKNAGVLPLMLEANAFGVMQMGCLPDKKGKGYREMKSGMKALYIAGSVPDADFKADFIIVQASHANALTERADLVLPMAALYEKHGTIVNTYGTQKIFGQAQQPAGEIKDGVEIAAEISSAVSKTKAFKAKDIASQVKKVKAGKLGAGAFSPVKAAAAKPYGVSSAALLLAMNNGLLSSSAVIKVIEVHETVTSR
jgi:predicted molibdopterin-dependent oxidoreductase YjgC